MSAADKPHSRLVRVCDAIFSGREDALSLGVVRSVVAGILFLSALAHAGAVAEYFSDASMINGEYARLAFPSRWSLFFTIRDPTAVVAIWAVGVLAMAMWTVGLFTRISSIVAMVVWASMYGRNNLLYAYPDQYAMVLGYLLMLMPAGRGFSLDARWRGRGGTVPVWCRRILQLQVAIMYTATGLEKTGDTWQKEGTAIYYTLANPYNRHFDMVPTLAAMQPWLLRPLTFAVVVWETAFGAFTVYHWLREFLGRKIRLGARVWRIPDLRWLFLGFGVAMHLGIQLGVYVVFFSPLAIGAYLCFLTSEDLRALLRWRTHLRAWRARLREGLRGRPGRRRAP